MKTLIKACLLSLLLLAHGAFAADLKTTKEQGLVGEQNNGYLGLVKSDAPADVKALVADVNAQRKNQFAQIAAKNGIAVEEAAKVFAKEAAARTPPGNYVQSPGGGWVKRYPTPAPSLVGVQLRCAITAGQSNHRPIRPMNRAPTKPRIKSLPTFSASAWSTPEPACAAPAQRAARAVLPASSGTVQPADS